MTDTDDLDFDDTLYVSYNCDVDITSFTIFKDYEECIKHCKEHREFAADEYAFNGVKYVQTKEIYYWDKGVINND